MHSKKSICLLLGVVSLSACIPRGPNPVDPYESINRRIHRFNMAIDRIFLKPPAKFYRKVLPNSVRKGINNFYTNLDLVPTVVNDLLQAQGKWAIKDTWRLFINSSLGVGGLMDVACKWGLPPHSNDLGLTLAKWGDKNSPYFVVPFLGPSTFRDGAGWLFQFALYSPYVYLRNDALMYSLLGLRYVDLRSQYLDSEQVMNEAFDEYSFVRDAYLQHRNYLITGTKEEEDAGALYLDEAEAPSGGIDYVDE